MEGIEDKLDYIISIEPKRHKELLAEIRRGQVPPSVTVDLSDVVSANNQIILKVKELIAGSSSAATLAELAAAIKENNKLLAQIAAKTPAKKEYVFEVKRNKYSDLIETITAKEK